MLNFREDYYSNIPILENHALKNSKDKNLKNCLVLVHPYHCELNGEYMSKIQEFSQYKNRLEKIFDSKKDISLVLFEEPKNYSEFTYELVEKNFFDRVIFTNGSSGEPYRKNEIDYFENKNVFIGGMYNGLCLSNAIGEINEKVPVEKIIPIREISLNTWFRMKEQGSVFPKKISFSKGEAIDAINFENFSKYFLK
jgi:hypothetical protein